MREWAICSLSWSILPYRIRLILRIDAIGLHRSPSRTPLGASKTSLAIQDPSDPDDRFCWLVDPTATQDPSDPVDRSPPDSSGRDDNCFGHAESFRSLILGARLWRRRDPIAISFVPWWVNTSIGGFDVWDPSDLTALRSKTSLVDEAWVESHRWRSGATPSSIENTLGSLLLPTNTLTPDDPSSSIDPHSSMMSTRCLLHKILQDCETFCLKIDLIDYNGIHQMQCQTRRLFRGPFHPKWSVVHARLAPNWYEAFCFIQEQDYNLDARPSVSGSDFHIEMAMRWLIDLHWYSVWSLLLPERSMSIALICTDPSDQHPKGCEAFCLTMSCRIHLILMSYGLSLHHPAACWIADFKIHPWSAHCRFPSPSSEKFTKNLHRQTGTSSIRFECQAIHCHPRPLTPTLAKALIHPLIVRRKTTNHRCCRQIM